MKSEVTKKKIGALYEGIQIKKKSSLVSERNYYVLFIAKRLVFVLLVMVFNKMGCFQLQFLIFLDSLYVIWYGKVKPHYMKSEYRIILFNEVATMICFYHLLMFT